MKRILWLMSTVLCFCAGAYAQTAPHWEIAGGAIYADANVSPSNGSRFSAKGGTFSITENINSWFGGRFEMNSLTATESGANVNAQTYTFGPVFSYHKLERITPFGEAQFGAIHGSKGYLGISASATRFAMAAGGGFDAAINRRAAIRIQGDYMMTHFLSLRQNNLLISAGIVVRFGNR